MKTWSSQYFYGNKISDYGLENGYVDYRTLAKAFDAVLANDLMSQTEGVIGWWEMKSGGTDNSEEIELRQERIDELETELLTTEDEEESAKIQNLIDEEEREISLLEDEEEPDEVFQWFIVDDNGARILKEFNEIVYYNEELDLYLWGVTHFGTSWDYVLTNIKIELSEEE